jgi:predicted enzyme related to lactoylglutathione lyase
MDWKLEVVIVPVSDVDRAKEFYSEKLGFNVDVDRRMSESMRVVQLTPPGSACSITIGEGLGDSPPGSARLQICVEDIEAAHAELVARGADVGPVSHFTEAGPVEGKGEPWNSFVFLTDADGNHWAVQERPAAA